MKPFSCVLFIQLLVLLGLLLSSSFVSAQDDSSSSFPAQVLADQDTDNSDSVLDATEDNTLNEDQSDTDNTQVNETSGIGEGEGENTNQTGEDDNNTQAWGNPENDNDSGPVSSDQGWGPSGGNGVGTNTDNNDGEATGNSCSDEVTNAVNVCGPSDNSDGYCSRQCHLALISVLQDYDCEEQHLSFLDALPSQILANCNYLPFSGGSDDSVATFQALWNYYSLHYPFFAERGIDWDKQYQIMSLKVSPTTSEDTLWNVLVSVIRTLNDAQCSISRQTTGNNPILQDGQIFQETSEEFNAGIFPSYTQDLLHLGEWLNNTDRRYLFNTSSYFDGTVLFGLISSSPSTAYIRITSFDSYTSIEEWSSVWHNLFSSLSSSATSELIVDLRWSYERGNDEAVNILLSHFIEEQRLAYSTKILIPDGSNQFSPVQQQWLSPIPPFYTNKPLVILTSLLTTGAAEVFSMGMKAIRTPSDLTIIGEATQGAPSKPLPVILPNGWRAMVPIIVYQDPSGRELDGIGVVPDIMMALDIDNFKRGVDDILQTAIDHTGDSQA